MRFMDKLCHARGEYGEPEWPPSPLRLYQSLVASAAGIANERRKIKQYAESLRWLENQPAPTIVAPAAEVAPSKYRLYVPDNIGDTVAKSWSAGRPATIADYRAEKDVQPMRLESETVHYLYALAAGLCPYLADIQRLTRSVTHLGWGIDLVVGNAEIQNDLASDALVGERWVAHDREAQQGSRIPMHGTIDDLGRRHEAFLNRLTIDDRDNSSFAPVPPLRVFRKVQYRRATDVPTLPIAAFSFLRADDGKFKTFNPTARTYRVADAMRYATKIAAEKSQKSSQFIAETVLGHGESRGKTHEAVKTFRLAYLPLPTIEYRADKSGAWRFSAVRALRRGIITTFSSTEGDSIQWVRRALTGADVTADWIEDSPPILSLLPDDDRQIRHFTAKSSTWTTVSPVVLPGLNSRGGQIGEDGRRTFTAIQLNNREKKTVRLIRKAIREAGYSNEIADNAEIEVRAVGFLAGLSMASQYQLPERLSAYPRTHVRINFRNREGKPIQIPGPLCLGRGRYFGLGLFIADPNIP